MSLDVSIKCKIDSGNPERQFVTVYDNNITHNLGEMAKKSGIYYALWWPDEDGFTTAKQIIPCLTEGLARLESNPDHFKQFNAPNGFGNYEDLVLFVENYLEACKEYPNGLIEVTR